MIAGELSGAFRSASLARDIDALSRAKARSAVEKEVLACSLVDKERARTYHRVAKLDGGAEKRSVLEEIQQLLKESVSDISLRSMRGSPILVWSPKVFVLR